MQSAIYYLLPLAGAIIGWLFVTLALYLGNRPLASALERALQKTMVEPIRSLPIPPQLVQAVDGRMNRVVDRLKERIPLASLFLTDSLRNSIQSITKEEILTVWPELREALATEMQREIQLHSADTIANRLKPLRWLGAIMGAILGFVGVILASPL